MQTIAERGGANQQVPPGQTVAAKGQVVKSLVILQKGQVSVNGVETGPMGQPILRPLYNVNAPAVIAGASLFAQARNGYHIVTSAASEISVYPSNKEYLLKLIAAKPNIGVLALKSVYKDLTDLEAKQEQAENTWQQLDSFELGFSIALSVLLPEKFSGEEKATGFADPLLPVARVQVHDFVERGGNIVKPLNINFLRSAKNQIETVAEKKSDSNSVALLRRLVSLPQDALGIIAVRDPQLLHTTAEAVAELIATRGAEIDKLLANMQSFLQRMLVGDYAWISKFALQAELMESNSNTASREDIIAACGFFAEGFTALRDKLLTFAEIAYPPYQQVSLQKIQKTTAQKEPVKAAPSTEAQTTQVSGDLSEFQNSVDKILAWSETPADKTTQFKKDWDTLKKFKNPLDGSDDDVRKLRRRVSLQYWEIFERGMLKYLRKRSDLPRYMRLFFDYGFMDETQLDAEHLSTLMNASYGKGDPWLPIYTVTEWLAAIYDRKVATSVSEMGLTFFETLRQDPANRDKKWRRESDLPPEINSPEARVKFEIKEMLQMNCRLCSGNISSHLNILTRHQITQQLSKVLITKDTVVAEVRKIVGTDFGAFHREVLYTNEAMNIQREFIQVQITPNIVLVPSIGTVIQFWQDREGNDRMSRGRLIAPIMVTADLHMMLLKAIGTYRWEMCKTTMGPDWNNISVSSLTADYTDYVQFYYKSKELSEEIKEKLGEDFKRFRDDRARFVNDYSIYMRFESDGSQRMNRVSRKIFTKHVPFSKEIRERLLKLPSYTDVVQKSINIRKKKANELTPRYTKYERENKSLPKELSETRKFYNMEY
ncbi:MAG: hypothetical protein J0L53_17685 [Spirochaetes bacterium]|nr:hypothetical protein [Spirochaetota bacterium]